MTKEEVIKDLNDYDRYLSINELQIKTTPILQRKKSFKEMFGYEVVLYKNGLIQVKYNNNSTYTI